MDPILVLLIIQFLVVFVVDYSGAVEDMFTPIVRKITGAKIGTLGKPFSCSLCMNFYSGLLALIIMHKFTLPYIAAVLGLSILTPVTLDLIWFVRDFIQRVIGWLRYITGLDL